MPARWRRAARAPGIVGYNVQTAVDTKHHLIVAHEVTNVGNDRAQLSAMAEQAREAMGQAELTVLADRGYFDGEEILACERAGITPLVPKPMTSGAKADGRFGKQDFVYLPEQDAYRCPAGETHDLAVQPHRRERHDAARTTGRPGARTARSRPSARRPRCAASRAGSTRTSSTPCSAGWTQRPDAMRVRRQTVEHPFGTIKAWMGADPLPHPDPASGSAPR